MPKYHVFVPEVHYQTVEIEADSPEEAAKLVNDGGGECLDGELEYSHTLEGGNRRVWCPTTKAESWVDLDECEDEED